MKPWKIDAIQMSKSGASTTEICSAIHRKYPDISKNAIQLTVYRARDNSLPADDPAPAPEKITVVQNHEPAVKSSVWSGQKIVRFGLMGDTHINSKYTQLTHLHRFYDICELENIRDVYHAGDIDEGDQMRMGHQYDCYNQGADDHVNEILRVYPYRRGMRTYFITGNHDASITKRSGHDIGKAIADKRNDLECLGPDCAVIYLTPNCTLELRHPWDGTAYAVSYKIQKMIEAMSGGEKPNILGVGHYHKSEKLTYRNVHCFQTGTFCAQTPFMRGKGISAMMGGWIIEAHVDTDGYIQRLKMEEIPFYTAIKDDYKNWQTFNK